MLWKRKAKTPLNSDEHQELTKKITSIVGDLDNITNRLALVDAIVKSNRARISKIKVEEILMEGEKPINDDTVYL